MGRKGLLFCFEGGEGSGKTTQAKRLYDSLIQKGLSVILTREPGGTPFGETLRRILRSSEFELTPTEEFLLFSAARAQLVRSVIKPSLLEGKHVILDRYFYSSFAYQGGGGGLDLTWMREITERLVGDATPDLVFFLDIDPKIGLSRRFKGKLFEEDKVEESSSFLRVRRNALKKSRDSSEIERFQAKGLDFHNRVRSAFKKLAKENPSIFVTIDADKREEEIAQMVFSAVSGLLFTSKN